MFTHAWDQELLILDYATLHPGYARFKSITTVVSHNSIRTYAA